jgi:sec-independent protein translocase protein TatC
MAKTSPAGEMPFLDHLEELRWRLIWALGAFAIALVVAFAMMSKIDIIRFLEQPVLPYLQGRKLVFTHPADVFGIVLNASFVLGLVLASPVIIYQIWAFLSPALYQHEKRLIIPVLLGAVGLFCAGVALSFYVVLPFTLGFLLTFQTNSLEPMITAGEYFGFAISMSLAFGAVFELPILILGLTALGIITPAFLNKYRRHAIVLCIVGAAFITPGADPTSLFALAVPLYFLFEMSVVLSGVVYKRRQRKLAAEAAPLEAERAAAEPATLAAPSYVDAAAAADAERPRSLRDLAPREPAAPLDQPPIVPLDQGGVA